MERTRADVVCLGEGEHLAVELMEALAGERPLRSVAGIRFRENGAVVATEPRPPVSDLDALPLPAYHLFPMEAYQRVEQPEWVYHILPGASNRTTMITNRGCPFRCTFCRRSFEPKKVKGRTKNPLLKKVAVFRDGAIKDPRSLGPATVEIKTTWGTVFSETVEEFKGHPKNTMTEEECRDKFLRCSGYSSKPFSGGDLEKIMEAVLRLERLDNTNDMTKLLT